MTWSRSSWHLSLVYSCDLKGATLENKDLSNVFPFKLFVLCSIATFQTLHAAINSTRRTCGEESYFRFLYDGEKIYFFAILNEQKKVSHCMPAQVLLFHEVFPSFTARAVDFHIPGMSCSQKLFDLIKNLASAVADCSKSVKAGNSTVKELLYRFAVLFCKGRTSDETS